MIETASALFSAVRREGQSLFEWWATHSVDAANGGFVGEIDADGVVVVDAPKAAILNTRLLWYFSAYYNHTKDPRALELAHRAAAFIRDHFTDEDGALWWMTDAWGRVTDTRKHAYVQAFGIYAFAEYYAVTGEGMVEAKALQIVLNTRYRDVESGGWLEAPVGEAQRLSEKDMDAPKTMNSHLHILEAYTRLHQLAPTAETHAALTQALDVFITRFVRDDGHLRLFFTADWEDVSRAVSFGHDIEASWLVHEAANALGGDVTVQVLRMAEATLAQGLNAGGGLKYERGFDGHEDAIGEWWCQAEAMVGFANAYELTQEAKWLDALRGVWAYSVDKHGLGSGQEWTWYPKSDARRMYRAGAWKCPYHTGRAMMELERRLRA